MILNLERLKTFSKGYAVRMDLLVFEEGGGVSSKGIQTQKIGNEDQNP